LVLARTEPFVASFSATIILRSFTQPIVSTAMDLTRIYVVAGTGIAISVAAMLLLFYSFH